MSDLRQVLERARGSAPRTTVELDQVIRRREREQRTRRVGATVLGLSLTIALIAGTVVVLAGHPDQRIGIGGGPSADLSLGAGEYYYTRTAMVPAKVTAAGNQVTTVNGELTTWLTSDGSGRIVATWFDGSPASDRTYGPNHAPVFSDYSDTAELSTDPATLERQLRDAIMPGGASPEPYDEWVGEAATPPAPDQEGPITWGLVRVIGELLASPAVRPELKAALFRVAAGTSGVTMRADAVDPVGRPAIELSIDTEDQAHRWWFDATSEQPLALVDVPAAGGMQRIVLVREAGIVTSTTSDDLIRSFVPMSDASLGPDTTTMTAAGPNGEWTSNAFGG